MKRFELKIDVFIDAENESEMWEIFRNAGLHDILYNLDAKDGYKAKIVNSFDVPEE